MVDVTSENFERLLPDILKDIKSSLFVAIDTEFTGLLADIAFKNSLFDDGRERYGKQCKNIDKFTICQLGLAVYKSVPESNQYTVTSYNVYLQPQSCTSYDPFFLCQTSSIEFLKKYKFDFNKWLYDGVPFMNSDEAAELLSELRSVVKGDKDINLPFELHDHLSSVKEWASSALEGATTSITTPLTNTSQLLLVTAIRNLLLDLWADLENGQIIERKMCKLERKKLKSMDEAGVNLVSTSIVVRKVSESERKKLRSADGDGSSLVSPLVQHLLGFTVVFQYLAELQKPVVLHNCFLDLMLIYKQFHRHLPPSYDTFKSELHRMFPLIYDTKVLSSELRRIYKDADKHVNSVIFDTALGSLAASLMEELPVLYRPSVTLLPHGCKYDGDGARLHEAGYDAYLTGFCFLSLSHFHAMLQLPSRMQHRPLSPREHLYALKAFVNRVQIQQARTMYINLAGSDPRVRRPPWLLVEARHGWSRLTPTLVSTALAHHGHIEVRPFRRAALVATTSWKRTSDIYQDLASDKVLKAQVYNRFRHSPVFRTIGWSVGLVSSGLSVWLFYQTFKKALGK